MSKAMVCLAAGTAMLALLLVLVASQTVAPVSIEDTCENQAVENTPDTFEEQAVSLLQQHLVVGKHSDEILQESAQFQHQALDFDLRIDGLVRHHAGCAQSPQTKHKALAGQLKELQWLHIPKTGTSFIATVWNYACGYGGAKQRRLDLNVDVNQGPHCGRCYDFSLMERYPKQDYCKPGVLADNFSTTHVPTSLQIMKSSAEQTVGFFRKPSQRLISGFHDGMHASGFANAEWSLLLAMCRGGQAACYARFSGIAGCMARMLTGGSCAESYAARNGEAFDSGRAHVAGAIAALSQMSFVGLTEEWDESVCLFHVMFGGRLDPFELKNFHSHRSSNNFLYDEGVLDGFVDEADEEVYRAAKKRFDQLRLQYVGNKTSACSMLGVGANSASETLRLNSESQNKASVHSCSCAAVGRQCGLEGKLDCGVCPHGRLQLYNVKLANASMLQCGAAGKCLLQLEDGSSPSRDIFDWFMTPQQ